MLVLLIVFCLLPVSSIAQNEKALIKKGNEAYEKKEYDNAITQLSKGNGKEPG